MNSNHPLNQIKDPARRFIAADVLQREISTYLGDGINVLRAQISNGSSKSVQEERLAARQEAALVHFKTYTGGDFTGNNLSAANRVFTQTKHDAEQELVRTGKEVPTDVIGAFGTVAPPSAGEARIDENRADLFGLAATAITVMAKGVEDWANDVPGVRSPFDRARNELALYQEQAGSLVRNGHVAIAEAEAASPTLRPSEFRL